VFVRHRWGVASAGFRAWFSGAVTPAAAVIFFLTRTAERQVVGDVHSQPNMQAEPAHVLTFQFMQSIRQASAGMQGPCVLHGP
jgi:hypothetical protein